MKKLLFLVTLPFCFQLAFSQVDHVFNYNYPLEWQYDCTSMIMVDSNYCFCGNIARTQEGCGSWLMGYHLSEIKNDGIKDTTIIYDKCNETTYIGRKGSIVFKDDILYIVGLIYDETNKSKVFTLKLTKNFDTIDNYFFLNDTLVKRCYCCAVDNENNLIFCGGSDSTYNELSGVPETTYSKAYLNKVNSSGQTIWAKSYYFGSIADGCWSTFYRVLNTYDNGYIATGRTSDFGNSRNFILKTDSLGNQQWVKFYGNFSYDSPVFSDIITTHDSCYIVCGAYTYGETFGGLYPYDGWLIKLDNNGNEKWNKKHRDYVYGSTDWRDTIYSIYYGLAEKPNGDIIAICGTRSDDEQNYIGEKFRLRCIDSLGNKRWDKVFTSVGNQQGPLWPKSIQLTDDGGIAIGGWAEIYYWNESNQWVSDQRIFLIKTDSLGNDTLLSDITPYEAKPITDFDLICYPNPANNEFFVDLPQGTEDDVLEIYSINGALVQEQAVGVFNNRIDICNVKPGMYLLKLREKGLYGKLIIE